MSDRIEAATGVVKDVLQATLAPAWCKDGELDSEARAIAQQLHRIRSHRDASLAIQRVFSSAFGDSVRIGDCELALASRLLVLRLRAAGLLDTSLTLEGYTSEELLRLVRGELRDVVFSGSPLVFTVASAQVLGSFRIEESRVVAEIAHVDGGGEGVLPFLSGVMHRFAIENDIPAIEWLVHALTCANPNAKLRALLERRGFQLADHNGRPVLRLLEPAKAG